jgi:hypothetical protein
MSGNTCVYRTLASRVIHGAAMVPVPWLHGSFTDTVQQAFRKIMTSMTLVFPYCMDELDPDYVTQPVGELVACEDPAIFCRAEVKGTYLSLGGVFGEVCFIKSEGVLACRGNTIYDTSGRTPLSVKRSKLNMVLPALLIPFVDLAKCTFWYFDFPTASRCGDLPGRFTIVFTRAMHITKVIIMMMKHMSAYI